MTLEELFETADTIIQHKKRAQNKRPRKLVNELISNPGDLSPEAYKYFAKVSTGVAQEVSVRYTSTGSFLYISHSKFK